MQVFYTNVPTATPSRSTPRYRTSCRVNGATGLSNCIKVRKKTFNLLLCIEVHQTFGFPVSLLRHYQMPEYFCVQNCF